MAYHHLGQRKNAEESLEKAGGIIDRGLDVLARGPAGTLPLSWWEDWLESYLLYREAKTLIDGSPPAEDPRWHMARVLAFAALGDEKRASASYAKEPTLSPNDLMVRIQALPDVSRADEYAQTLADLRTFSKEHPQQPLAARLALAQRELPWGTRQAQTGQFQAAAEAFAQAASGFEAVITGLAANADSATAGVPATAKDIAWYRHELGYVLTYEGEALRKLGRLPEAEAALTRGLEVHESLVNDAEAPADTKSRLVWTQTELAMVFQARGLPREAEQKYRETIALLEGQGKAAYSLGGCYEALAQLCETEGRTAEAIEAQRKAVATMGTTRERNARAAAPYPPGLGQRTPGGYAAPRQRKCGGCERLRQSGRWLRGVRAGTTGPRQPLL